MGWGRRAAAAALTMVLAALLTTALTVELMPDASAVRLRPPAQRVTPVLHREGFADPSVVSIAGGYLAISTGFRAPRAVSSSPRGPWHPVSRALPKKLPHWVRSPQIWASELVRSRTGWLLYYSAVAHGKTRRCIGVATARHPLDAFRPVGRRPLVCPQRGAIDPSGFVRSNGGRYLLFKTQGNPTSIRLLRLTRDGRHRGHRAHSRVLLRSQHTIENPVLVRRKRHLVLFTSEGYFGSCGYETTWRRSKNLFRWGRSEPHPLLRRTNTRICGPGGADVLTAGRKNPVLYFHGWTCGKGRRPCPPRFVLGRAERPYARRVMYAAHLRWKHGTPRVHGFIRRH
ncbi:MULTISPECIES: glycoside hydrolase family 43 protein [unclassified Nocardioides]|uniref:glycoside hydrolase family 43 protein n=1 Tax=unclassified Nocardioides TaxID=2615069 RepID=UPI00005718E9|nr:MULTISPECIES: glycoside hydrolase family 43 protein [unclassified Nocardioides]ABL84008.1 glycoside hydrolase, family 43 [Nocardioides sp. JS614]